MKESSDSDDQSEDWRVRMWQAVLCGSFLLLAIAFEKFTSFGPIVVTGTFLVAIVIGGWDTAFDAFRALRKGKVDIHFLMLTVAVGAAVIGAWQEGALLLFLFALGGALEHFAIHRMNREITALSHAAPKVARVVLEDGSEEERDVDDLVKGDRLVVRPDEIFPVDALVLTGETEVDESTLTGEAMPVVKKEGDELSSGTLNLWGLVTVEVIRPVDESSLSKIIGMIRNAQESKAPSQRFTDRFGSTYAIGVLGAAALMFAVWWLGFELEPKSAFYRAMALLVVASPCALVLSIPSAILAGIAWGARHGVLFRGGSAIEGLAEIDVVALDKTGTLTAGQMEVIQVESYPAGREEELMEIAVSVESESNHPVARAITRHGEESGLEKRDVKNLRSLTGLGIQAEVDGRRFSLGKRELVGEDARIGDPSEHSLEHTEVWLVGEGLVGRILLQDEIRHESRPVLERLRRSGITTMIYTGSGSSQKRPDPHHCFISKQLSL